MNAAIPSLEMQPWNGHNRRNWRRWDVDIEAVLEIGALQVRGTIRDISRGGILFETRRPLDVGEDAILRHLGALGHSPVRVMRRELRDDGTIALGMRFVGTSPVPGTPESRSS